MVEDHGRSLHTNTDVSVACSAVLYSGSDRSGNERTSDGNHGLSGISDDHTGSDLLTCAQRQPLDSELTGNTQIRTWTPETQKMDCATENAEHLELSLQSLHSQDFPPHPQQLPSPVSQPIRTRKFTTVLESSNRTKHSSYVIPPTNRTLQSLGKGTVILVKFTAESDTPACLLSNPLKLNKLISGSEFSNLLEIIDIRPNIRKSLLAIENKTPISNNVIQRLTKVAFLGNFAVHCYIPKSDSVIYGTIHPVALDTDLQDLTTTLNEQNDITVVKIDRLKKRLDGTWVDSLTVKLSIESLTLPSALRVDYVRFVPKLFIPSPMQCYKCQRIGHTTKSCTSRQPRCMLCGGSHDKLDCKASREQRSCANCRGNHSANSSRCPTLRMAVQIEKVRLEDHLDYSTARSRVVTQSQHQHHDSSTPSHTGRATARSYASVVSCASADRKPKPKVMVDASSQTDITNDPPRQSLLSDRTPDFFVQLRSVLLDVLNINTLKESKQAQSSLIDHAISHSFGVTLKPDHPSPQHVTAIPSTSGNCARDRHKRKHSVPSLPSDCDREALSSADEADVLSDLESSTDVTSLWDTVEKVQVKRGRLGSGTTTRQRRRTLDKQKSAKASKTKTRTTIPPSQ